MFLQYILLVALLVGYHCEELSSTSTSQEVVVVDDNGTEPENKKTKYIAFGFEETDPKKFPYIVLLGTSKYREICAGTILNKRWILSSVECAKYEGSGLMAYHSITNQVEKGKHAIAIGPVITHPNFDSRTFENDIALFKTKTDIPLDKIPKPVKFSNMELTPNKELKIIGWGQRKDGETFSEHLLSKNIVVYDGQKCQASYKGYFNLKANHFCVIGKDTRAAACHGDFGAPILTPKGDQVGVVTWFSICSDNKATIVTKISPHITWINSQIKNVK